MRTLRRVFFFRGRFCALRSWHTQSYSINFQAFKTREEMLTGAAVCISLRFKLGACLFHTLYIPFSVPLPCCWEIVPRYLAIYALPLK
jgi:hypothetical protein